MLHVFQLALISVVDPIAIVLDEPRRSTMTNERILVFGDDGTPAADVAWLWINNQRWPGWRLQAVSAQMPELPGLLPRERTELHVWEPPHPRQVFAEAGFIESAQLMAESDPRLVLSVTCDLLVIGPRGPGLLKSLYLGSTADWLVAHPVAPLVIVRHAQQVRSVVLCTDGSRHAQRVTGALADLPWLDQLRVTVLAVDDRRCDVDQASTMAAEQLQRGGATVDVLVVHGKPTDAIMQHLDSAQPDMVALGTRGLTGLHRLRVGSTAAAVARAAACSALVACVDDESSGA